jgi:soluble lytic murein transglycosylase-like protein
LATAVGPGQVFVNCQPYLDLFNQWGGSTGIPPILLAAIASQESDCNQNARGPNGEYGLMQITPDKCPVQDNSCLDPNTNIQIGATYFGNIVSGGGGNLALALGEYNGWYPGLTENEANSASTCGARNNLDYVHMVLNGFMQGVDPRANPRMGIYFNTDDCN